MTRRLTRRTILKSAALAAPAVAASNLAAPFVRGAHAAGSLKVGFWDHWVPGANDVMTKICKEWAEKEKVDISIDFITTQGDKLILTAAAEAQARSGHDILALISWYAIGNAAALEPMDDLVKQLQEQNGKVTPAAEYLGTNDGHWIAVPANVACQTKSCPTNGPGTRSLRQPRNVTKPAIHSACRWVNPRPTPPTWSARCSIATAPSWWTRTATSPSRRIR